MLQFLVADMQLYKALSVSPTAGPSMGPSIQMHGSKSGKTSVVDACLVGVGSWGWNVDGGRMPLPTRLQ